MPKIKNFVSPKQLSLFDDVTLLYLSISKSFPEDLLLNYNYDSLSKFRVHNGLSRYGSSQHELLMFYAKSHFKVL